MTVPAAMRGAVLAASAAASLASLCTQGVNYPGDDLPGMPVPLSLDSPDACADMCAVESACALYVYIPLGCVPGNTSPVCYLKGAIPQNTSVPCMCSGFRPPPVPAPPAPDTCKYPLSPGGDVSACVGAQGLVSVSIGGVNLTVELDAWSMGLDGFLFNSSELAAPSVGVVSSTQVQLVWSLLFERTYTFSALYELQPGWNFVRKTLSVMTDTPGYPLNVIAVSPFSPLRLRSSANAAPVQWLYPSGAMGGYGAFVRMADDTGVMVTAQNPFLYTYVSAAAPLYPSPGQTNGTVISLAFHPSMTWYFAAGINAADAAWPQDTKEQWDLLAAAEPWGLTRHPSAGPTPYVADAGIIGAYTLSQYSVPPYTGPRAELAHVTSGGVGDYSTPESGDTWLNYAERDAFRECADAHTLLPPQSTVKVHIPWTENDYQVNIANATSFQEYVRILARLSQLGISHILYAAQNTDVSSVGDNTDDWGWEMTLWINEGQNIRQQAWYPGNASVPESMSQLLVVANALGVHVMPYIYPILGFEANSSWLFPVGNGRYHAQLDSRAFQDWLINAVIAFDGVTNSNGAGYDYTFFQNVNATVYAQWYGWRRILGSIRLALASNDSMYVVDNRQLNHEWGPWMWAVGSYAEPLQTDEGPYSWPAFALDPHTDRQSANRQRQMTYAYAQSMFCQQHAVPGFMQHQTDRFLDGGITLNELNVRDYDFYGATYSILSSIATGGLNNVVCGLPARDEGEFTAFPTSAPPTQVSVEFYRTWLGWTDAFRSWVARTKLLPVEPGLGLVDGSYMMLNNTGFIFLFNPNAQSLPSPNITFNEFVDLTCEPADVFTVTEVWPVAGAVLTTVPCGGAFQTMMEGRAALVLNVTLTQTFPAIVGRAARPATMAAIDDAGDLMLTGWQDAITRSVRAECEVPNLFVLMPVQQGAAARPLRATAAGVRWGQSAATVQWTSACPARTPTPPAAPMGYHYIGVFVDVPANEVFVHSQPVQGMEYNASFAGGLLQGTVFVPAAVFQQLADRNASYPVPWDAADVPVAWLVPGRLIAYVDVNFAVGQGVNIPATLDGTPIAVQPVWSCRSLQSASCFSGYWIDLTAAGVQPATNYSLAISLPSMPAGAFGGVFYDNVDTVFASG